MTDYKDLTVWQRSISFVESIYESVNAFPKTETYALSDQIRRAAISIPSNIAEGSGRNTTKEFIHFLYIALGSACEVETQLIIAKRLNYLVEIDSLLKDVNEIRKMLNGLINSLKRKNNNE